MKIKNPFKTMGWKTYLYIIFIVTMVAIADDAFSKNIFYVLGFYIGGGVELVLFFALLHFIFVKQDKTKQGVST